MNITVLAAIVLAAALVHGSQGQFWSGSGWSDNFGGPKPTKRPCEQPSSMANHESFVHKHILDQKFKRSSLREWERYLDKPRRLCGRVSVQTFIDEPVGQVNQVCGGGGRRVTGGRQGNLCMSVANMTVYEVESKKGSRCKVTNVRPRSINVVLACNKVSNCCLPVHYEENNGQKPTNQQCF